MDYWESGMDNRFSRDIFDSFIKYQRKMKQVFMQMNETYGFEIVNGNRSPRAISQDLQRRIEQFIEL